MTQHSRIGETPATSLARKWKESQEPAAPSRFARPLGDSDIDPQVIATAPTTQPAARDKIWTILLVTAGLLPVLLNALLALINAHVMHLSFMSAALAEVLVLAGAVAIFLTTPKRTEDRGPIALLAFFIIIALAISMVVQSIQIEVTRNLAIVACFSLVGLRSTKQSLRLTMTIASVLVAVVLLLEIISTPSYVAVFQPAEYFAATRGIEVAAYNDTGLFGNALGWEGRFSILNIMDHRGSSLFLEQVSLGNFAMVISIYLGVCWADLSRWERGGLISLVCLILVATASRTASSFFVMAPIVVLLAPRLPRFASLAVLPLCMLAALVVFQFLPASNGDDLAGRIGYTMRNLADLDLAAYFGAAALSASWYADSGYVYLLTSTTIFGVMAFWLYVSLFPASSSPQSKIASALISIYVFMNLLVSGTSIFSLKTAAVLWIIAGCSAAVFAKSHEADDVRHA